MTAAICRWLKRQGVSVAPFKAQNMSLNSTVTPQRGGDRARAGDAGRGVRDRARGGDEPGADQAVGRPQEPGAA